MRGQNVGKNDKPSVKWQTAAIDAPHVASTLMRMAGVEKVSIKKGDLPDGQVYLEITCTDLTVRARVLNQLGKR